MKYEEGPFFEFSYTDFVPRVHREALDLALNDFFESTSGAGLGCGINPKTLAMTGSPLCILSSFATRK